MHLCCIHVHQLRCVFIRGHAYRQQIAIMLASVARPSATSFKVFLGRTPDSEIGSRAHVGGTFHKHLCASIHALPARTPRTSEPVIVKAHCAFSSNSTP